MSAISPWTRPTIGPRRRARRSWSARRACRPDDDRGRHFRSVLEVSGMSKRVGCTAPFRDSGGGVVAGSVAEAGFWRIGGLDQWVMVRGRSADNPLLVILHGGPGGSETAF